MENNYAAYEHENNWIDEDMPIFKACSVVIEYGEDFLGLRERKVISSQAHTTLKECWDEIYKLMENEDDPKIIAHQYGADDNLPKNAIARAYIGNPYTFCA